MVAVMLGTTFFDGFSRTSIWQNRYYQVQVDLLDKPSLADLVGQLMSVGGLLACVAFVGLAFRLAVRRDGVDRRPAAALAGVRRQPDPDRARLRRSRTTSRCSSTRARSA